MATGTIYEQFLSKLLQTWQEKFVEVMILADQAVVLLCSCLLWADKEQLKKR